MEEKKYYCPTCGTELTRNDDNRKKRFMEDDLVAVETPLYCDECEEEVATITEYFRLTFIPELQLLKKYKKEDK